VTRTPEERLASLEQQFSSLEEGFGRVEKAVEKLTDNVTAMMDRLDARYPSRESVDLRFSALEQENAMLKAEVAELKQRVNRMSAWQYKAMGAVGIAAFASGLVWYIKHW
jgi:chromosome segregation ATPase